VLRDGRQFVVSPSTVAAGRRYGLPESGDEVVLPEVEVLPDAPEALIHHLQALGGERGRSGEPVQDVESLTAPSVEKVREAVARIPNGADVDRNKYIWMAHRIRAACGRDHEEEAREIFLAWAAQYPTADPDEDQRVFDTLGWDKVYGGWEDLWRLAAKYEYDASSEQLRMAQEAFAADDRSHVAVAAEVAPPEQPAANVGGKFKVPVAQKLFRAMLGNPNIRVFHSSRGKRPYVQIRCHGRWQTHALDGASGTTLLRHLLSQGNRPPSGAAFGEAVELLKGYARYEAPARDVYTRVARINDTVFLDLGDETHRAIAVTATEWRIIDDPPVRFVRSGTTQALREPQKGGSLADFRRFFATESDEHLRLLLHYFVDVFSAPEDSARPLLVFDGPPGSGKTTMTEYVKRLTDPHVGGVCAPPENERDLVITARSNRVVAFDNASKISWLMSDALCRLASGGGVRARKLYTDEEETVFDERRHIIVNSIGDVAKQADLRDRCVFVPAGTLTKREDDTQLRRAFEQAQPGLFGLLLDAVSAVLAGETDVEGPTNFRMAGFAKRGLACAKVLGWTGAEFLKAYNANIEEASANFVQNDLVARALRTVSWAGAREWRGQRLRQRGLSDEQVAAIFEKWGDLVWYGPAADLLEYLDQHVRWEIRQRQGWPRDFRWFGRQVSLAAPALKRVGLEIVCDRTSQERVITIRDLRGRERPREEPDNRLELSVEQFL
jgi:hypothetical protein